MELQSIEKFDQGDRRPVQALGALIALSSLDGRVRYDVRVMESSVDVRVLIFRFLEIDSRP
jgi:hypothetical protein